MNAQEWHDQNKPWVHEYKKSYYEENKEKIKARSLARYHANKETISIQRRNRYHRNLAVKLKSKEQGLAKVGWTLSLYQERFTKQKGECAICERTTERKLSADHDHITNEPRELLCSTCNVMLGNAKDSPSLLEKAAAYLRKHGK
jgi:hypothetical protein